MHPSSDVRLGPASVRPWREVKSRRGAPKRVNTEGFACPNQQCPYSGITDASIHTSCWRWQGWPCRADPDDSRPYLSHDFHCPAPHPLVPSENPLSPDRNGPVCVSLWAGCFRGPMRLRLPSGHHHQPFCLPLFTSDGLNVYFYAPLSSFWIVARGGASRAEGSSMAGSGGPDLRPEKEKVPTAEAGRGLAGDTPWDRCRPQGLRAVTRLLWTLEHRF